MKQAISLLLLLALLGTGLVAAIAITMPKLIILGLYLIILPGLILILAPAVFIYELAFAIPWFVFNRANIALATSGGLAAVVLIGFGIPFLLNPVTTLWQTVAESREARPQAKIAAVPVIGLLPAPDFYSQACNDLCQTLLYNGAVQRVVMLAPNGKKGTQRQISFRAERLPRCLDTNPRFLASSANWLPAEEWTQTAQTVRLKFASGECLIQDMEWAGTPDLIVQQLNENIGETPAPLALVPGEVNIQGLQLLVQGKVVARESDILPRHFTYPLLLNMAGAMENPHFEWNRKQRRYRQPTGARPFLLRFTELNVAPLKGLDMAAVASRIDEALADASLPATDGAFALLRDYFDGLPPKKVADSHVQRLARLIADPRLGHDAALFLPVYKLNPTQRLALRNPVLDRMWELAQVQDWRTYRDLSRHLEEMPPGAFRNPDPRFDRFIAEPELCRNAPVLVKRLADRGPAEAPRLLSFVREGNSLTGRKKTQKSDLATAALTGICRLQLGKSPQSAKPILEALRSLPGDDESELWRATLISAGSGPTKFDVPHNRKMRIEQYRKDLTQFANKGCSR